MTAKRAHWTSGVARSHEELEEADADFWARATPEERVEAAWTLNEELWMLMHPDEALPRLRGAAAGVRRRGR